MRKTSARIPDVSPLTVDLDRLCALLCCGQATARRIAAEAEARVNIGRRVLYSVDKVRHYLETMAE